MNALLLIVIGIAVLAYDVSYNNGEALLVLCSIFGLN
jgi:hypothetical protein